ncbi:MAG: hypothetical protein ABIQ89_01245 [Candidatus Saccharimonadales bacterium]
MNIVKAFDNWHKTRRGYATMATIELALAYLIGSRALDTGSWWQYGFTLLLLIGGIQNVIQFIRKK